MVTSESTNSSMHQRRIVVGMGKTGQSCARFLAARGEPVIVLDSRAEPPNLREFRSEFPDADIHTGGFDAALLAGADEILLSPGVDPAEPAIKAAVAHGAVVLGDIELFYREARAPIVAITGTNAKSTVTSLVWLMAQNAGWRVACGGNLGTPALELLADDIELYVLELSSFQLETLHAFRADVAAFLNLAPDHLDRYTGLEDYQRAKQRIFQGTHCLVFNRDDEATTPWAPRAAIQFSFGLSPPRAGEFGVVRDDMGEQLVFGDTVLIRAEELALRGRHNLANSLAAMAIAHGAGIPLTAQLAVLRGYTGLPHRCQHVRRVNEVDFYNDSKGTNVAAVVAALKGIAGECSGKIVLIAGGIAKESDFSAIASELAQNGRAAILIGRDAPQLAASLAGSVTTRRAESMEEAVSMALGSAAPGDVVLLSPACASFDMFRNFEDRGEKFETAVRALAAGGGG